MDNSAFNVATIWRYPIKSMMGEELNASAITALGVLGDRAFALVDEETDKVVSAKIHKNGRAFSIIERPMQWRRAKKFAADLDYAAGWRACSQR